MSPVLATLAWRLARADGWGRLVLLAGCTAVVSGLLLVAIALLHLPAEPQEALFELVADPGTRVGTAFGGVLLCIPPLLLLHQVVRLGTAARERRLAALRLAGATPGEVRRVGALEVGLPVALGGILGIGVYAALRALLGGARYVSPAELGWVRDPAGGWSCDGDCPDLATRHGSAIRLVPTTVAPAWWELVAVVAGVTLLGVAVGLLATRRVVTTPLGVTRRSSERPPRPWGLLLVGAGLALGVVLLTAFHRIDSQLVGIVVVGLVLVGLVSLAPWVAARVGRAVARRASTAPVLLAASRLATQPRPAGRAAAAVGAIAAVAGTSGSMLVDLLTDTYSSWDDFYYYSLALVFACLLVALVAVVGSLAVHSVESLLDRRRSMAGLGVLGADVALLERAQRWEAGLVALPMTVSGVLLGSVVLGLGEGLLVGLDAWWVLGTVLVLALMLGVVWLAIIVAVRLTRPWARRAADPANLRTA